MRRTRETQNPRTPSALVSALVSVLLASLARPAAAQTEYYNLDANRPVRVEDAVPTERRSLDVQFAPLRYESILGGTRRLRADPTLSYGVASLTEIELRVPILFVEPSDLSSPTVIGFTNVGIGATRALNTETSWVPALALSVEMLLPIGSLEPPQGSYAIKGLLTKTMFWGRLSANGAYGTWSAASTPLPSSSCSLLPPGAPGCNSGRTIPDVPCARVPVSTMLDASRLSSVTNARATLSTACLTSKASNAAATGQRTVGNHWFAGAAIDHTFPLSSTLIVADVFAERFIGLYPGVDWTAEVGVRRQWSMTVVLDAGISRHFLGNLPSTAINFGLTYAIAM